MIFNMQLRGLRIYVVTHTMSGIYITCGVVDLRSSDALRRKTKYSPPCSFAVFSFAEMLFRGLFMRQMLFRGFSKNRERMLFRDFFRERIFFRGKKPRKSILSRNRTTKEYKKPRKNVLSRKSSFAVGLKTK